VELKFLLDLLVQLLLPEEASHAPE
jgi:hypothetical protein